MSTRETLAFLGGTGAQGRGLALRLARAGHPVLLGSRHAARAEEAAAEVARQMGADAAAGEVRGVTNAQAGDGADVIFVTVPYDAQQATLTPLAEVIGEKIVVNCVNALAFDDAGPYPVAVPDGSAAQECARLLPRARVVSAFHEVSARRLLGSRPVPVDVLVCGDDADAKERAVALAGSIPGMTGVDAGPLRLSRPIEDLTAVLLSVNRRYRIHAGLRIEGLRGRDG